MSRTIHTVSAAVALGVGLTLATSGQASAANSGSATCVDGSNVVGVWVEVQGGNSGWANRSGQGSRQGWNFNTQGKKYKLTAGCGGSPQRWAESTSTPSFQNNWQAVNCWPGPSEKYGDGGKYAPIGLCVR